MPVDIQKTSDVAPSPDTAPTTAAPQDDLLDDLLVDPLSVSTDTDESVDTDGGGPLLDPLQASLEALFAEPPPPKERTDAQKERDLESATIVASRLIEKYDSADEVEAFFPRLTTRYGLKKINWVAGGQLEIQVNPKAVIDASALTLNAGDTTHSNALTQDVSFKTASLGGDTVAVEMTANRLGPNHPQGGPPGGALSKLMDQLPTDPKLAGTDKYIKGHLLNDNLGGPGSAANLFPITAQANKDHENYVESVAKQWVNEKGFWIYYHVKVKDKGNSLSGNANANKVDADLECTVQKLDSSGKRTSDGFFKVISSRKGSKVLNDSEDVKGDGGAGAATKDASFDADKVEWSTAKGDASQPQELESVIRTETMLLDAALADNQLEAQRSLSLLNSTIKGSSELQRTILLDPDHDIYSAISSGQIAYNDNDAVMVGTWNKAMNALNKKASEVQGYLMDLTMSMRSASSSAESDGHDVGSRQHRSAVINYCKSAVVKLKL